MLAEFAVRRWQFTLVLFIALCALGLNALSSIPKAEDPTFPIATFSIAAVLPGSSPADIERLVVDPLETKLKALDDGKRMRTEIDDGLAVIQIEFESGVDPARKHDDVLRETAAVRPDLPAELVRLDVQQFNAALVNVVEVALISDDASYASIDHQARRLKRRLENRPGIGEVEIAGLPKQEVSVSLDLPRMVALGISPQAVIQAITAEGANVPAGNLDAGTRRFNVKTSGDYASVDEIRRTVVQMNDGAVIELSDIADVQLQAAEASQITRFNGRRAVLVAANQKEGANLFDVMRGVDDELQTFAASLPPDIRLERGFEQLSNVSHRLRGFSRDFGLAIVLVLLTLLPLGTRASLVVMISIPLSLAIGLLSLKLTGFSINQLSIVGFVIALGLLVDDSVVVVENITRHLREGLTLSAAAIAATRQITASVIGCTATLVFAFLPLLALPGTAGQFIRSMPLAIVFTIVASLLVSLTIVPFLASVLLKREREDGNIFLRALHWTIEGSYRRVLERALAHPFLTLMAAGLLFAGSIALVPRIGFSLFPKAGTPQFLVRIETAEGASLNETDRARASSRRCSLAIRKSAESRRASAKVIRASTTTSRRRMKRQTWRSCSRSPVCASRMNKRRFTRSCGMSSKAFPAPRSSSPSLRTDRPSMHRSRCACSAMIKRSSRRPACKWRSCSARPKARATFAIRVATGDPICVCGSIATRLACSVCRSPTWIARFGSRSVAWSRRSIGRIRLKRRTTCA
ncbi:MAG TPA: efflux RND transporter permease subunit [Polyangiales bacterium]|nr:efflux RND transporter permease subunit [Polyangiales bacterium]